MPQIPICARRILRRVEKITMMAPQISCDALAPSGRSAPRLAAHRLEHRLNASAGSDPRLRNDPIVALNSTSDCHSAASKPSAEAVSMPKSRAISRTVIFADIITDGVPPPGWVP